MGKMEGYFSTGQSPQQAVVPVEEGGGGGYIRLSVPFPGASFAVCCKQ
jgi:hypothetical protein